MDLEKVHCGMRWRWSLRLSRPLWSNKSVLGRCLWYLASANAIGVLRNRVSLLVNEYDGSWCSDDRIRHIIPHAMCDFAFVFACVAAFTCACSYAIANASCVCVCMLFYVCLCYMFSYVCACMNMYVYVYIFVCAHIALNL